MNGSSWKSRSPSYRLRLALTILAALATASCESSKPPATKIETRIVTKRTPLLPLPTRFEQCFATKRIAFRAAEQYIADLERERGNMSICGRELLRWYEAQRRQVTGPK